MVTHGLLGKMARFESFEQVKQALLTEAFSQDGFVWYARAGVEFQQEQIENIEGALDFLIEHDREETVDRELMCLIWTISFYSLWLVREWRSNPGRDVLCRISNKIEQYLRTSALIEKIEAQNLTDTHPSEPFENEG